MLLADVLCDPPMSRLRSALHVFFQVVKHQSYLCPLLSHCVCRPRFSIAAPKIWKSLPPALRVCTCPDTLRLHLRPTVSSRPANPVMNPLSVLLLAPLIRLLPTILCDRSFFTAGPRLWNSLPEDVYHHRILKLSNRNQVQ